jgi:hypothetical protein
MLHHILSMIFLWQNFHCFVNPRRKNWRNVFFFFFGVKCVCSEKKFTTHDVNLKFEKREIKKKKSAFEESFM